MQAVHQTTGQWRWRTSQWHVQQHQDLMSGQHIKKNQKWAPYTFTVSLSHYLTFSCNSMHNNDVFTKWIIKAAQVLFTFIQDRGKITSLMSAMTAWCVERQVGTKKWLIIWNNFIKCVKCLIMLAWWHIWWTDNWFMFLYFKLLSEEGQTLLVTIV